MDHEILIYNKTGKRIPKKFILNAILLVLNFLKLKQPTALAVLIVNPEEIRKLNKDWRQKDEVADELSFGLNSRQTAKFAKKENRVLELGEIIINIDKIADKNYLFKILVHSLLHLIGYNHEKSEKEAIKIEQLEEKILKALSKHSIFS